MKLPKQRICKLEDCENVCPIGEYFCSQDHKDKYWHEGKYKRQGEKKNNYSIEEIQKKLLEFAKEKRLKNSARKIFSS